MARRPPDAKAQRDKKIHIPGSYEAALTGRCRFEVTDPVDWLAASGDAESFAEFEREVSVLAGLAFDENFGRPVISWWYWLPTPLPLVWRGPAAPRRFRVTPDDLVEPLPKGT